MSFLRRSCLNVILRKNPTVSSAIYVVVKSEGNQDLSRKSSKCKIYVVLNRNILRGNSHHLLTVLNIICLIIDDIRNSSCLADTGSYSAVWISTSITSIKYLVT